MSKLYVVAVKDSAIEAFNRPFYVPAVGAAVRSFTDEVNRKAEDNPMHAHPDDYSLHVLAVFDDETGTFSPENPEGPRLLARGKDIKTA